MNVVPQPAPSPRVPRLELATDEAGPPQALLHQLTAQQEELRTQNEQLVEAQQLFHEALAEYTDLYDHAPVGFVTLDANGLISRMNAAGEELIGVRRDRLAGLAFHRFVAESEQDRAAFREHVRRCRAGDSRVVTELTLVRVDGRQVPVELISRTATGAAHRFFRTVIVDLTERQAAEADRAALTAALERRTAEAEQNAARLRALAVKLTEAENAERRRLARNLHDHLQQELVAAKYAVAIARGAANGRPADLGRLEASFDRCLESARQITADLTPPPLQHKAGLPAALRWLADRTREWHGLAVTLSTPPDGDPAADAVRGMLYAVTRELLLNVVKHAGVPEANVSLTRPAAGRLRLSVSDEGQGFELAELPERVDLVTGLGLFGLRERVENLGGRIEIRSRPGDGTTVTIEVPDSPAEPRTNLDQIPR